MATESLYNTSFKVNGESYTVTFDSSFSNYIYAKDENGKMVRFDKNDPLLSFQQKENPNLINYEEKIAETQAKIKSNYSLLKEHKQSWFNAIKEKMNFSWQMHQCKIEAGTLGVTGPVNAFLTIPALSAPLTTTRIFLEAINPPIFLSSISRIHRKNNRPS